ncbi:MAG TPA: FAD-dependent monooxygenase [Marmoricola sp.]|nr:FAD-dependent monooxygenase [Marmoricola sp.]
MIDLLVVGGGPAGLAAAMYAVREGLDVTVLEQRAGVVDKACGEGLMPGALAALLDLKVDPAGHEISGIRYVAGPRSAEARFRQGPGRGVRRTTLHRAMREAALDAGVRLEQRAAGPVTQDGGGVSAGGVRAGYCVAADGLHSPVRRALGLDAPPAGARRFGLRRHFRAEPWTSFVEVHWGGAAEAYVTPVAPEAVGVAMLTSMRGSFDEHLHRFPALAERLTEPLGDVLGAGPLRQRSRARVRGRVLLVGDASGYVDALTGEGVALALAQARAAVAAVRDGEPERYERDWHQVTRRYRLLTAGLLEATRWSPVRRALVPAATRLPTVFGAAVNALARPA